MSILVSLATTQQSTLVLYRFSVDDYHRMIAAGMLRSGDRIELLEGLLAWVADTSLGEGQRKGYPK